MGKRIYTLEQKERKRLYDIEYQIKNAEKKKEQGKQWRENNSEKKKEQDKQWCGNNKERKRLYDIQYRNKNSLIKKDNDKEYYQKNKEDIKLKSKEYRENNKDKRNIYQYNRRKNDPLFKLTCNISTLIRQSFKRKGFGKNTKTAKILSCNFNDFKSHIESLWEPWMNWDNYGNWNGAPTEINTSWDIDHIIPISTATTENDIIKLNHYTNLQPLCSFKNRWVKVNKIN